MKVHHNIPLSSLSYYHIGGVARIVLEVSNESDIFMALEYLREQGITKTQILGLGANILLPDEDFDGAILWLHGNGSSIELIGESEIKVFAGESMDALIRFAFDNELIGLEWAGGLPSSVGGAVRGNAGAFGSEIKDSVVRVETVNYQSDIPETKEYTYEESQFSYRNSFFKENSSLLIISVVFNLKKGSAEELKVAKDTYAKNISYRQSHHPMEYPSCGSVFMNVIRPEDVDRITRVWPDVKELSEKKWHNKVSMGYVIDRLGYTGKRIGNAQVSPKHSNYIVNLGDAKAKDVESLIIEIKEKFFETFGFYPTPEVMIPSHS